MAETADEIRQEIASLKRKRIDLKNEIRDAKRRLAKAVRVPAVVRGVTHALYAWLAVNDMSAWRSVEIEAGQEYAHCNDCDADDCWYTGNLDRLGGLDLFSMGSLCGSGYEATVCDVCIANDRVESIYQNAKLWNKDYANIYGDDDVIFINKTRYAAKYHAKIEKCHAKLLAAGEFSADDLEMYENEDSAGASDDDNSDDD
jgi:hypothetical protein